MTHLKISFVCVAMLALVWGNRAWGDDLGGSVLRDYPTALTVPEGRFEVSLDYLAWETEGDDDGAFGDAAGGRLLADWGITRRTMLLSALTYAKMDLGEEASDVVSMDLSLRRSLIQRRYGRVPKISGDAGVRINQALDDVAVSPGGEAVWSDLRDTTGYLRLTAGQIWGPFFPHLFLEGGYSEIEGALDSQDLSRSEGYLKTGVSLFLKFPYRALLHLEYDYLKLFREEELDETDDDHILKADLNYYLTPFFIFNIGGRYSFHRQNGRIPFLYNEATQNGFDRDYRQIQAGVTFLMF